MLHGFPGKDTVVGAEATVGHGAVLHGCAVRRGALIGMNCVVNDNAEVGEEAMVAALAFVKAFFDEQKPVAVICHGPWTLIDAGVVRGRRITSYPTLQTDLKNAGAEWMDQEVVVDRGLISSRKPDDIPVFNRTMIEEFSKARRQKSTAA